jgi:hypothetical protein
MKSTLTYNCGTTRTDERLPSRCRGDPESQSVPADTSPQSIEMERHDLGLLQFPSTFLKGVALTLELPNVVTTR